MPGDAASPPVRTLQGLETKRTAVQLVTWFRRYRRAWRAGGRKGEHRHLPPPTLSQPYAYFTRLASQQQRFTSRWIGRWLIHSRLSTEVIERARPKPPSTDKSDTSRVAGFSGKQTRAVCLAGARKKTEREEREFVSVNQCLDPSRSD